MVLCDAGVEIAIDRGAGDAQDMVTAVRRNG